MVPRLAQALAGAGQAEVVAVDAGRAHLHVEAHCALPEAGRCHRGLVVEVARQGQAPLDLREESSDVEGLAAAETVAAEVATEAVVGAPGAPVLGRPVDVSLGAVDVAKSILDYQVTDDAVGADLLGYANRASFRTLECSTCLVVVVPHERNASLGGQAQVSEVDCPTTGKTVTNLVAGETIVGTFLAPLDDVVRIEPKRT